MKSEKISMGHGGGGKLMHELISGPILKAFDNPLIAQLGDSAVFDIAGKKVAFSTDSHVIKPVFYPGGDIGKLAVAGTVNDLAVVGATPLYLSCGLILEEGFNRSDLEKILNSMSATAKEAGIQIITGDTKVVEKGAGDEVYINTAGIGLIELDFELSRSRIKPGDKIIINGTIGDHGAAIISVREGIGLESDLKSDCTNLNNLISKVLSAGSSIKFMRDPTRGGVAAVLNEIASKSNLNLLVHEKNLPVKDEVKSISEILGMDPIYIPNEGKVLIFVDEKEAQTVMKILKEDDLGKDAAIVGEVCEEKEGLVTAESIFGTKRIIDMPVEEQLPRIC